MKKLCRCCVACGLLAVLVWVFPAAGLAAGDASPEGASKLRHVRIMLPWMPQSEFAGFIMARSKGYFTEQGLDVRFVWAQPSDNPLRSLKQGDVDVAAGWLSCAMVLRGEGVPLVNVLQLHQHSALMLLTRKDVTSLQGLNGKTVQSWGDSFEVELDLFMKRNAVRPGKVLPLSSLSPFLNGLVEGIIAMDFSEWLRLQDRGIKSSEMNAFRFAEHGVNLVGEGLYVMADTLARDPDLVRGVREAVLRGWRYAFANSEETLATIMRYSDEKNQRTNINYQRRQLGAVNELVTTRGDGQRLPPEAWGLLDKQDFTHARDLLASEGYPVNGLQYEEFCMLPGGE